MFQMQQITQCLLIFRLRQATQRHPTLLQLRGTIGFPKLGAQRREGVCQQGGIRPWSRLGRHRTILDAIMNFDPLSIGGGIVEIIAKRFKIETRFSVSVMTLDTGAVDQRLNFRWESVCRHRHSSENQQYDE